MPWRFLILGVGLAIPACGGGYGNSTADIWPPITTATPPGGSYGSSVTVMLTADDTTHPVPYGMNYPPTVYYSTDGNNPSVGGANTTSGASPLGGILIGSGTTTLKFFSVDASGNVEAVNTDVYIIP
jgi:hypothetical protein